MNSAEYFVCLVGKSFHLKSLTGVPGGLQSKVVDPDNFSKQRWGAHLERSEGRASQLQDDVECLEGCLGHGEIGRGARGVASNRRTLMYWSVSNFRSITSSPAWRGEYWVGVQGEK